MKSNLKLFLEIQWDKVDTEVFEPRIYTQSSKKVWCSNRIIAQKKGRTSNTLIKTDGRGIPIAVGEIISRTYNDLYNIVPQLSKITMAVNEYGIRVETSVLNADKGFDSKSFRRFCRSRKMVPNVKENIRNRNNTKWKR